jgi:hypothetical protein
MDNCQKQISASHAQSSYPQGPDLEARVWPRLWAKPSRIASPGRAVRHFGSKWERSIPPSGVRGKSRAQDCNYRAVVIGVHLAVELKHARRLHRFYDGFDLGPIVALGKNRRAIHECVRRTGIILMRRSVRQPTSERHP